VGLLDVVSPALASHNIKERTLCNAGISGAEIISGTEIISEAKKIIIAVQRELALPGYYHGRVDGLAGPQTEKAIRRFESPYLQVLN